MTKKLDMKDISSKIATQWRHLSDTDEDTA